MRYRIVEHLLRLLNAANKRTVHFALGKKSHVCDIQRRFVGKPNDSHFAAHFQHGDILYRLVVGRDGADDEIERVAKSFHLFGIVHIHIACCTHQGSIGTFLFRAVEHGHIGTQVHQILNSHVSQSAVTGNRHLVAFLDVAEMDG